MPNLLWNSGGTVWCSQHPQYFLSLPLLNEGGCKQQYVNQKGNKDSINMDIREIYYEDVNWTELVQKEEQ